MEMSTMSERIIDQATGLPPLPPGQWWEVREYRNQADAFEHFPPDGYEVCIVTKHATAATSTPAKFWWSTEVVTPGRTVDRVIQRKQITDPELFAARLNHPNSRYYNLRRVGKLHITPGDVLKAALDIVDRMSEDKAALERRAASNSLLGAYPPKALETT